MNHKLPNKHCTVTAFLYTQEKPIRFLLLHHKKLNVWLPPGGHREPHENFYQALIREVQEETNLDIRDYLPSPQSIDQRVNSLPTPNFILEETIPSHGDQPTHFHLDLVYTIQLPHQVVKHRPTEAHDIGWFTRQEISQLPTFPNITLLIDRILANLQN